MEKVFVAVLAGDNRLNTSLVELANHLPYFTADPECPFEFAYWTESGVRGQELARNRICKRFLATKADILLMIDNDMVLAGWASLRVLSTPDYDIAAPLQLMFDGGIDEETGKVEPSIRPCAFVWDDEAKGHRGVIPAPGVEVQEVDAVGGGMIAIRRRVLEDPGMLLAPDMDPPAYWRTVVEPNYVRIRGNDVDFCHRARTCGYGIKVNWGARTGHLKTVDLWQAEIYAKQQFMLGYEVGERHALSVVEGQGREVEGPDRGAGPVGGDAGLAGVRLDRGDGEGPEGYCADGRSGGKAAADPVGRAEEKAHAGLTRG